MRHFVSTDTDLKINKPYWYVDGWQVFEIVFKELGPVRKSHNDIRKAEWSENGIPQTEEQRKYRFPYEVHDNHLDAINEAVDNCKAVIKRAESSLAPLELKRDAEICLIYNQGVKEGVRV